MRRLLRLFCIALSVTALSITTSCARPTASVSTATATRPKPTEQFPTIVRLIGRHYTVTISAAPHAPVYTIVSASGDVLAEHMTLAQLRATHPDLYNGLAPAMAPQMRADARDAGPMLWAGIN
jgi:hypothetical protein